jgi:hypothetical protein
MAAGTKNFYYLKSMANQLNEQDKKLGRGTKLEDKFKRVATKDGSVYAGTADVVDVQAPKLASNLNTSSSRFVPKPREHPVRAVSDPIDIQESIGCAETASQTDSHFEGTTDVNMEKGEKKSKFSKTPNVKKNGKLLEVEEDC